MECPITLHEPAHPVAFASLESQPYELHALCDWLELSCRNPLTGRAACVGDLVPLGSDEQRRVGAEMLERRSLTIVENQVFYFLFLHMTEMQPLLVEDGVDSVSRKDSVISEYKE